MGLLFTAVLIFCLQMGWGKSTLEDENTDLEPRIFFGTGTGSTTSVTIGNAGYIALGAALLIPLIAGLALLFYLFRGDDSSGYSSYGNTGGYSSYARSSGQKFNPYGMNWENLSILDWISMGQEAWDKFDPANLDCQKRLICEIHQNKAKLGPPAQTMVDIFGYLHYAEILSLPDELKMILEEYMEASEKGRTMQKDCQQLYMTCDFSMSGIINKFSTNEI